jgi:hypothetical protein
MLDMTPTATAPAAARRLVLVPAAPRDRGDSAVRRFRLARVRLDDDAVRDAVRPAAPPSTG